MLRNYLKELPILLYLELAIKNNIKYLSHKNNKIKIFRTLSYTLDSFLRKRGFSPATFKAGVKKIWLQETLWVLYLGLLPARGRITFERQRLDKTRTQSSNSQRNFLLHLPCSWQSQIFQDLSRIPTTSVGSDQWAYVRHAILLHHIQNFPHWAKHNNRIWS